MVIYTPSDCSLPRLSRLHSMNGFAISYKKREKRYSVGQTNSPFTHLYCLLLFDSNKIIRRVRPTPTNPSTHIFLCSEQHKRFFFRNKKQNKNHLPSVGNYESFPAVLFSRLLHYNIELFTPRVQVLMWKYWKRNLFIMRLGQETTAGANYTNRPGECGLFGILIFFWNDPFNDVRVYTQERNKTRHFLNLNDKTRFFCSSLDSERLFELSRFHLKS